MGSILSLQLPHSVQRKSIGEVAVFEKQMFNKAQKMIEEQMFNQPIQRHSSTSAAFLPNPC